MALELYTDFYWYPSGAVAVGVPAYVFPRASNTLAVLWDDAAGTVPLPNPLPTEAGGVLAFWAEEGEYWVHLADETFLIPVGAAYDPVTQAELDAAITTALALAAADAQAKANAAQAFAIATASADASAKAAAAQAAAIATAAADATMKADAAQAAAVATAAADATTKANAAQAAAIAAAAADATTKANAAQAAAIAAAATAAGLLYMPLVGDVIGKPRVVRWAADQVLTLGTLVDGTHGALTLDPNAVYSFDGCLNFAGDAASDLLLTFTSPAGVTGDWTPASITLGNSDGTGSIRLSRFAYAATAQLGVIPAGSFALPHGTVVTAAAGGTFLARLALNVVATPVTIRAGSWLRLHRIA